MNDILTQDLAPSRQVRGLGLAISDVQLSAPCLNRLVYISRVFLPLTSLLRQRCRRLVSDARLDVQAHHEGSIVPVSLHVVRGVGSSRAADLADFWARRALKLTPSLLRCAGLSKRPALPL
jgi:hypothetical protein